MKFTQIFAVAILCAFAGSATAASLTIPHTFVSGEAARAAEVNNNFNAVKTEVDDNNARILQNAAAIGFKLDSLDGGSCVAGETMRGINSTGGPICGTDIDTLFSAPAGSGLLLNGTGFSIDPLITQKRVNGVCNAANESIKSIDVDGNVTCETDDDTTYTAPALGGLNLVNGAFTVDFTETQQRVNDLSCDSAGKSIKTIKQDGTVTCEDDTDTEYNAGTGMQLITSTQVPEFRPANGRVSLSPMAFLSETGSFTQRDLCVLRRSLSYTFFLANINASSASCDAYAPVQLPDGATLTRLDCTVFDGGGFPGNSLQALLRRVTISNVSTSTVFDTGTSTDNINPQTISDTTATNALVNNSLYTYILEMRWSSQNFQVGTDSGRIYGCSIAYEYR